MSKQSIKALREQIESGKIETDKVKVYAALQDKRMNLDEARQNTGLAIQTLTGRLSELMDVGVVAQDEDGRFYTTLAEFHEFHATQRRKARFTRWVKRGEEEGFFALMGHA